VGHLAKAIGTHGLIIGYRLLPDGSHPVPLQQSLTAYRWLLDQGIEAGKIAVAGDSAGHLYRIFRSSVSRRAGSPRRRSSQRQLGLDEAEVQKAKALRGGHAGEGHDEIPHKH
jgi:hypothetical protein